MSTKIVTAALVAAIFSSFVAASSASANPGSGGPTCGLGGSYNGERCVSNAAPGTRG